MQKPSNYQSDIYTFVKDEEDNALINAVAGSGKTTTIVNSLDYVKSNQDISFLAFNKSIVEHLKNKVKKGIDVTTFHSLGYTSLIRTFGKTKLYENKVKDIIYSNLKRFKVNKKEENGFVYAVSKLVDFIRLNNCENDIDKIIALVDKHGLLVSDESIIRALEVLRISNTKEEIDYIDMLYQPVRKNIKMKKYDLVFVDECQDLSIIQQQLFQKIIKPTGRFISVGDENQAIYGFAGSDAESFNNLRIQKNVIELPLSVCYRCGKSIVNQAQLIVPHIEHHSEAIDGIVRNGSISEIKEGDWVLCRNTKPLISLCIHLFKKRKKVFIKGLDFGKELIDLINKSDNNSLVVSIIRLERMLSNYYDKLFSLGVLEPDKTTSYNALLEKVEIIKEIIYKEVKTVDEAIKLITTIFQEKKEDRRITLSSIHRSKGFENDRIFVLRRDLIPNKFAVKDWQLQQERHLEYVCYTRAKKELIFITDFSDGSI